MRTAGAECHHAARNRRTVRRRSTRLRVPAQELLAALEPGAGFRIVPIDAEIAAEVAAMGGGLRDPADRAIVATARIHRFRLVTSDQRIVESKLVPVVE